MLLIHPVFARPEGEACESFFRPRSGRQGRVALRSGCQRLLRTAPRTFCRPSARFLLWARANRDCFFRMPDDVRRYGASSMVARRVSALASSRLRRALHHSKRLRCLSRDSRSRDFDGRRKLLQKHPRQRRRARELCRQASDPTRCAR